MESFVRLDFAEKSSNWLKIQKQISHFKKLIKKSIINLSVKIPLINHLHRIFIFMTPLFSFSRISSSSKTPSSSECGFSIEYILNDFSAGSLPFLPPNWSSNIHPAAHTRLDMMRYRVWCDASGSKPLWAAGGFLEMFFSFFVRGKSFKATSEKQPEMIYAALTMHERIMPVNRGRAWEDNILKIYSRQERQRDQRAGKRSSGTSETLKF